MEFRPCSQIEFIASSISEYESSCVSGTPAAAATENPLTKVHSKPASSMRRAESAL